MTTLRAKNIWPTLHASTRQKAMRLERFARASGYDSLACMLHELYESGLSIVDIGRELGVTAFPMRRILRACGIPIRPRGGRRWFRIEVTDTLLQEVMRDGIGTVAERLGVNPVTLSMRLRKYWREKKT